VARSRTMSRIVLFVLGCAVMSAACKSSSPAEAGTGPSNRVESGADDRDFDAFESAWVADGRRIAKNLREKGSAVDESKLPSSYRGIYLGHGGLIVDRRKVASFADLAGKRTDLAKVIADNVAFAPSFGIVPTVVVDLDHERAAAAVHALQLFVGHKLSYELRTPARETPTTLICSDLALRRQAKGQASGDDEQVELSLLLDVDRIWVALSRVNEFQEVPDLASGERDWDKLETVLREHKVSAFFADRADIEIGATDDAQVKAGDVMYTLALACSVGWYEIRVGPRSELSAAPTLP
jgi:hypothetical protein